MECHFCYHMLFHENSNQSQKIKNIHDGFFFQIKQSTSSIGTKTKGGKLKKPQILPTKIAVN